MNVPLRPHHHLERNWLLIAAKAGLLGWVSFWSWFVIAAMESEGVHPTPIASLLILWTVGALAWAQPRIGAFVLVAFGAWCLWYFRNAASLWLITAPTIALAMLCFFGARLQQRRRFMPASLLSLAIAATLSLGGAACSAATAPPPSMPFSEASIERHDDGSFAKGKLAEPTKIQGVPCRGWVRLHPDGSLSSFELAATATIQGHALPATSYVWLDEGSQLQTCFLSQDTTIQGYLCRGGPFKIATTFHADGSLRAFFPREPVTIDGVVCAASPLGPVYLHPDGHLAGCRLAEDLERGRQVLRRGTDVRFDEHGQLVLK
ncbi:MAG: hypothetical protein ABIP94_17455 [Planctomycetota bacterium]